MRYLFLVLKRSKLVFEIDSEAEWQNGIVRYYLCAEYLLHGTYGTPVEKCLRDIINKQDKYGFTPLHYASKKWPQDIVNVLLRFGADLSISNNEGEYPLKMVPETAILEVLDNHCIRSNSDSVASKKPEFYSRNQRSDQNFEIESKAYQKLCKNYDPRFMTAISDSQVTFDFELLSPTRIAKPDNIFKKGYKC